MDQVVGPQLMIVLVDPTAPDTLMPAWSPSIVPKFRMTLLSDVSDIPPCIQPWLVMSFPAPVLVMPEVRPKMSPEFDTTLPRLPRARPSRNKPMTWTVLGPFALIAVSPMTLPVSETER